MRKGWEIKKLGDLFEITSSKRVFESEWKRDGVPFYRAREIVKLAKHGFVDNELFISEEMFNQYSAKYGIPADGDIMVTGVGTLGICYVVQKHDRFYFKDGNIIWLKKKSEANSRFVEHAFRSDFLRKQIDDSVGATVGTFTIIKAKNTLIPLPPLPEQQRIVGILDEAFEGIATAKANAEKNLQNARAIFESHLQSVFTQRGEGWDVRKISEVAKHSLGKMLDKAKNKGKPQPYLRNINVRWFTFDLFDLLQMPFLPEESDKYTAIKGDVLICEGGYPGRAAIWAEDYPIYFQKALHRVRFHEPMHNKWFLYYLYAQDKSGALKQHFSGTGIQHFTGEVLARFEMPLPPLAELRRAVAKFEELSVETQRLESIYQQKLAALEALKKSLLHQAFAGQL
jgi:type I restriction enzyme S subunit